MPGGATRKLDDVRASALVGSVVLLKHECEVLEGLRENVELKLSREPKRGIVSVELAAAPVAKIDGLGTAQNGRSSLFIERNSHKPSLPIRQRDIGNNLCEFNRLGSPVCRKIRACCRYRTSAAPLWLAQGRSSAMPPGKASGPHFSSNDCPPSMVAGDTL